MALDVALPCSGLGYTSCCMVVGREKLDTIAAKQKFGFMCGGTSDLISFGR